MSYFSELEISLSEERAQKRTTSIISGPSWGSEGYLVTYDLTTDKGIEVGEIIVKGDLFDASRQAREFITNPNIDNIYVFDKKTGEYIQTILERAS